MNAKKKLLQIVKSARGDNLERCQNSFYGLSNEQMQEQHGYSEQTRQEVLDGYIKGRNDWENAHAYLLALFAIEKSYNCGCDCPKCEECYYKE